MIIDPTHSEIGFKTKHLLISTVKGAFSKFSGTIEGEENNMKVSFSLETSSINTNNKDRDGHLIGEDFFNSAVYPTIEFQAEGFNLTSKTLIGDITIKGITQKIKLDTQYNGVNVDPWGNTKHGFEISGTLNREQFGVKWNSPLPNGGVLVGEEVKLNMDIQMMELQENLETV